MLKYICRSTLPLHRGTEVSECSIKGGIIATSSSNTKCAQQCCQFWKSFGWTWSWWVNFEIELVVVEEWRENLRMSRASCCIYWRTDNFNEVDCQCCLKTCLHTLLLSSRGEITEDCTFLWTHSTDGVGNSRAGVWGNYSPLWPCVYIQLPFTASKVEELTAGFNQAHGIPQCLGWDTWKYSSHPQIPWITWTERGSLSTYKPPVTTGSHLLMWQW